MQVFSILTAVILQKQNYRRMYNAFFHNAERAYRPIGVPMHRQLAPRVAGHEIDYTDKIYICLTMAGRVIAEFTRSRFCNLSALLAWVRTAVPSLRGLVRLRVRNMTRGWAWERPLMLYPDRGAAPAPQHWEV